jgi:hypothetical protein
MHENCNVVDNSPRLDYISMKNLNFEFEKPVMI